MKMRAILLDADGVLVDSRAVACEVFNELGLGVGLPRFDGQEQLARIFGGHLWEALAPYGLTELEAQQFFSKHAQKMRSRGRDLRTFDPVLAAACACPLPTAVISSSFEKMLNSVFARSAVFRHGALHKVVGRDSPGTKSAKITALLAELQVPASNAIYVGDMASDIMHAREAGVLAGAVSYGYHPRAHLLASLPDVVFETPAELASFLEHPDQFFRATLK